MSPAFLVINSHHTNGFHPGWVCTLAGPAWLRVKAWIWTWTLKSAWMHGPCFFLSTYKSWNALSGPTLDGYFIDKTIALVPSHFSSSSLSSSSLPFSPSFPPLSYLSSILSLTFLSSLSLLSSLSPLSLFSPLQTPQAFLLSYEALEMLSSKTPKASFEAVFVRSKRKGKSKDGGRQTQKITPSQQFLADEWTSLWIFLQTSGLLQCI